jgi:predicted metalloendopeptidase
MQKRRVKFIQRAAIAAVFSVSTLLAPGHAVCGEAAAGQKPELGEWGVDLTTRNLDVKPGDDFFRHANGRWLDTFEIPADLPSYGAFTVITLRVEEQIKQIIEEQAKAGGAEGTVSQKIGDLYNQFMDQAALDAKGLAPLDPYFKQIAAAGSHEDIATLMAELGRMNGAGSPRGGGNSLFEFYMDQDEKVPSQYIPHFVQSGLGLPNRDYYLKDDNPRFVAARQAYREYLVQVFTMAGKTDPAMRADRILAMETEVAKAHWPAEETRDLDKTYNKLSRADLAQLAPGFPWARYLDALGMKAQDSFIVMAPSAYTDMATVFQQTPVEVWQDYLAYRLMRNNSAYLTRELDDATFAFTSAAMTGAKQQRERWKRGVQFVNGTMGQAVGKIYVDRHFSPTAKKRVDELVQNLLVAMGQRIDGLTWMGDETRKAARAKLAKFTVKIGYPETWKDYSGLKIEKNDLLGNVFRSRAFEFDYQVAKLGKPVDRKEWFMSPQTVNAYYNSSMNEIVFPAAILQPPFFDPYADDAVNYGGIGAVIGHEIGHGFDDQGCKSDGDGVLRDWWTAEDTRRFKERTDVLVARYNEFSPLPGMNVNGELTLGENIGDLGGLEIAHHAYRLSLDGKPAPVIDGMTGDQRFFLGYSQVWRNKMRDAVMTSMVASNEHSPAEFRVNGPLPNIDAWYDAFGVKPGDKMYVAPEKRIRIW